jgi:hypothetical protein
MTIDLSATTDTTNVIEPSSITSRLDSPGDSTDQIIRLGQEAWARVRSDLNWQDWLAIGRAHVIGRARAEREAHVNEPKGQRYKEAFSEWMERFGFENLDSGDRSRLFYVMDHLPQIEAWRSTLTTTERLRLNHPSTVLRKWKSATQRPPQEAKRPSPFAKMKESIIQLSEENDRLKREVDCGGGDLWSKDDRPEEIALVMVAKLSRTKAEKVAREILRRLKEAAQVTA